MSNLFIYHLKNILSAQPLLVCSCTISKSFPLHFHILSPIFASISNPGFNKYYVSLFHNTMLTCMNMEVQTGKHNGKWFELECKHFHFIFDLMTNSEWNYPPFATYLHISAYILNVSCRMSSSKCDSIKYVYFEKWIYPLHLRFVGVFYSVTHSAFILTFIEFGTSSSTSTTSNNITNK